MVPAKRLNDDTIDTFLSYLQAGGESSGIVLSDKHKEMLDRARYADEKLREKKYSREDVANFIRGKYQVCRDTAFKDIVTAETVFSTSYPLNKRYEIGARIEFLKKKIADCYSSGEKPEAIELEKVLQKYMDKYPDYVQPSGVKKIVYNIQNNLHVTNVTVEEAAKQADNLLIELEGKDDY